MSMGTHHLTGRPWTTPARFGIAWLGISCIVSLLLALGCKDREQSRTSAEASLPDLTACTKLEIRYLPSAGELLFRRDRDRAVLSTTELAELQSLETVLIDDQERIKALATTVASGMPGQGQWMAAGPYARIIYHRKGKAPAHFTMFGDTILTDKGHWFEYSGQSYPRWGGPLMRTLLALTPEIRRLELRKACAQHLEDLLSQLRLFLRDEHRYPPSAEWCDVLVRYWQKVFSSDSRKVYFRCPSQVEGECHYALNPACQPDSPGDMVLLFESKAGWNQHGGPELFTFDNHDPKGGLVLLNDGTVKFIRTEEQLQQLRWKQ
ncbi:MAG: hypothetical protein FJ280_07215 [Planctomycetes bacterium]|nr:hypothetical protein [Planctomycetota bacterium]